MCGIAGFWNQKGPADPGIAERMASALRHRGPDDRGSWFDPENGIGLAQRRLSIIDLSPAGHQPMLSPDGRFVLVYNGEIYNHASLRLQLEKQGLEYKWRGNSDTETLLAALAHWGLNGTLPRLNGMFAFALWDRQERSLSLARDRVGIKPLYYGQAGSDFVFGSELKALVAHPGFSSGIDRGALSLFFRYNYIPAPYSIYKSAKKLLPGAMLTIGPDGREEMTSYWQAKDVWQKGTDEPFMADENQAVEALDELLTDSVGSRMLSDVPLGAFLSGGIDSSTVVALMQKQASGPVKTFSIGFFEDQFNEAGYASAVARHLGTNHTELYVTPQDLLEVVPLVPRFWDEPFADASQIPTYVVCKLAAEQVTVSLSGDGGDELFVGYPRYFLTHSWSRLERIPLGLRTLCAKAGMLLPASIIGSAAQKVQWRMDLLKGKGVQDFYRYLVSNYKKPHPWCWGAMNRRCI
jgi:asparagine synthase (glutamine-hydrolysing)